MKVYEEHEREASMVEKSLPNLAAHYFSRGGRHLGTDLSLPSSPFSFDRDVLVPANSHL